MKRWNKIYTLYIEAVLALIAIAMGIMCLRYSSGERNNLKAVQKAENAPEEARMHLKKAVKLNPENPVLHLNLGLLYSSEDEGRFLDYLLQQKNHSLPDSTITEFQKAADYSENEPIPLLNLAFVYAFMGDEVKASDLLEPLVEQNFCWDPVRILYGLLLERQGRIDLAQETFTKAVLQTPIVMESQFFMELSERNPNMAQAIVADARSSAQHEYRLSGNPLTTAVLGEIEFIEGDIENAEIHLKEALSALPSMNRPWLFLGRIEESKGNGEDALDCYTKAVQLDEYDALPVYFKARAEGKASVIAEQMQPLLTLEPRIDLQGRYGAAVMAEPLIVSGFERYCTYDYVKEMEQERYNGNVKVLSDVLSSLEHDAGTPVSELVASIAEQMVGTPYEAGLLDVYPEKLRVYLDKTDNLHFIETCLAVALTVRGKQEAADMPVDDIYISLCDNIRSLRYRNGAISKFSDRIFYFTEWAEQAQAMGLMKEYSDQFGHEYNQSFSYLSDHLMYLPQIGREPKAREEILEIEKRLFAKNPLFAIGNEDMTTDFHDNIQDGDIVAIVSDRKGEDISKIGVIRKTETSVFIISASYKEKKVLSEDFANFCKEIKGLRCFRLL